MHADFSFVMPGLVPGIHGGHGADLQRVCVDGRVKPGHDEE